MSATSTRARVVIPSPDEAARRQRSEDRHGHLSEATDVRYSARTDRVTLVMKSGVVHVIPRHLIDELAAVPKAVLARELAIRVGGDAISLASRDIDISVRGLLRDIEGFDIQRRGGRVQSAAKAAAARMNGRKGGRPRKQAT